MCQDQRSHEIGMFGTATNSQHCLQVANYMVRDLSKGCMTCELLQPDELVSGLIAQVSSEPKLAALLSQIIDSAQGIQVSPIPSSLS